ncbi:TerB N-terminal domain-containing protein [Treponema sp. TIM-1]|uniref:TerB N-terminal domain-containing protein n=1 Tax=Treponema sp. TIM-1 TaxID=2898417 RepID=UPI0039818805
MSLFVPPEGTLIPREKLSLILSCVSQVRRGVGEPVAVPTLRYGKRYYPASALSRQFEEAFIPLGDKWVKRETLESLGIGPLGRLAGGKLLEPLKLKPLEVMRRGGDALLGVWTDLELKDNPWVISAPPDRIFRSHLDFLTSYGIPGGVLTHGEERSAASLGVYLRGLSGELGDGRVFVFMTRDYYDAWFCRVLPTVWPASAPLTLAGGKLTEGNSLFSSQFRGIGLCCFEDIPNNLDFLMPQCDILFFIEPQGITYENSGISREAGYFDTLKKIKTRLRLGIFTHSWDNHYPGSYGVKLRDFFSLRGNLKALGKYVIRDENSSLRMPQRYYFSPRTIRRPPCPFRPDEEELAWQGIDRSNVVISGGARFVIRTKFKSIRTPELKEEQQWFFFDGKEVPYRAYTLRHDHDLDFNRLEPEQRDYFFWWRGEFRRGNPRKTTAGYITLYARELILSMGQGEPLDNFQELLRLWRIYREEEPELDARFLPWFMDFMVLYKIGDRAFPHLIPPQGEPVLVLFRDLLLHKRYIEGDTSLAFTDFEPMLPLKVRNGPFHRGPQGPLLERTIETALRGIDAFLRKNYGKRFLEFFYPPHTEPVLVQGFEKLYGTGNSSYSVEWICFYRHRPLLDFFDALAIYIEYKLKERLGFEKKGREPVLEEVWKNLIDGELGFEPDKIRGRPLTGDGGPDIRLEPERVSRLRIESDEVRDLLHIDDGEPPEDKLSDITEAPLPLIRGLSLPEPGPPAIADFLAGLDEIQAEVLRILAGGDDGDRKKNALGALAKTTMTMPEFLIDEINEHFQGSFHDILIETMDEAPQISAEYTEDIRGYFAFEDGNT